MGRFQKFLTEGLDLFPDLEILKFDPDRTDVHDIAYGLLPLLIKISYCELVEAKNKHEKLYGDDPDETKFKFTAEELADTLDDLISSLREKLGDMAQRDMIEMIKNEEANFKIPFDKK